MNADRRRALIPRNRDDRQAPLVSLTGELQPLRANQRRVSAVSPDSQIAVRRNGPGAGEMRGAVGPDGDIAIESGLTVAGQHSAGMISIAADPQAVPQFVKQERVGILLARRDGFIATIGWRRIEPNIGC